MSVRHISKLRYRVQQFWGGLFAKITPEEELQLGQLLSPAERQLFERMPIDAKRHSLNVYQTLEAAGDPDPDLVVAALLHDVGKVAADESGVRLGLWLRGPLVVIEAIFPQATKLLASPNPQAGWRYALHVHIHHPQIGADWAEAAGSSEVACWLIASHQDQIDEQEQKRLEANRRRELPASSSHSLSVKTHHLSLLRSLQWADGQN